MKKTIFLLGISLILIFSHEEGKACTGISLKAADSSFVIGRTIEWGESVLPSQYVAIPRGTEFTSFTPSGQNGLKFKTRYGIVGISVIQKEFIADGMNETGLAAGLFYFPAYGQYPEYNPKKNKQTLADLQVVCWILSQFSSIDEVKEAFKDIRVTRLQGAATVHWRIAEPSGRQVVLEIVDGEAHFYENEVGILTNAPGFEWQVTNLNNYVNLYAGSVQSLRSEKNQLIPFGAGSGMLGLPGDITPPSRFVRAYFFQQTAPQLASGDATVMQTFHILNNFDIPIGLEFKKPDIPDVPSATQWTVVNDLKSRKLYYRTMFNSHIRCIDLEEIDFDGIPFIAVDLDVAPNEPIEKIEITEKTAIRKIRP